MTPDYSALAGSAWSQLWQVSVLILAVGLATRLFCRKRPHLAYVLWLLVIVKCLTPPVWRSPTGVFSWATAWAAATAVTPPQYNAPVDNTLPDTHRADSVADMGLDGSLNSSHLAEAPPGITPAQRWGWTRIIGLVWLAGTVTCSGVFVVMQLAWSWQLRHSQVSVRQEWKTLLQDLSRRLGVRREVRLLVTSQPVGPAVFGLFRPTLVLPEAILSGENASNLEAVLAHELIHVRRGDTFIGLLQLLAQTLWWFHPLVWWANREHCRQRERCCDEEVLAGLGCEPFEYAQSLVDLLKLKRSLNPIIAFPGIRPVEVTSKRLESIMDDKRQFRRHTPRRYWLALAAGAVIFLPGAAMTLGDPSPASDEATVANSEADEKGDADSTSGQPTTETIQPLDLLSISALGTLIDHPINGLYLVEPSGRVSMGPAYGRVDLKGLSPEEAEQPALKKLKQILRNPRVSVSLSGRVTHWHKAVLPKTAYHIKPGDYVRINALGTLVDAPIHGTYRIEPSGKVNLGPAYGRVQIKGLTLVEAETAIRKHLEKIPLRKPKVAVTMFGWKTRSVALPKAPYRIRPGELLKIEVPNALAIAPINTIHLVEATGKVCLGPAYGRVNVDGMNVEEAEAAIREHLKKTLRQPEVAVIPAGWMNPTVALSRKTEMNRE